MTAGRIDPMTMNASEPRRSTRRPANGESNSTGSPNIAKVSPIEVEARPEALEEQAPDDLVGAAGEIAAGVDDEGRDQAAVPAGASVPARSGAGRRDRRRSSAAARRVVDGASGGNSVESGDGAGWVRSPLSRRAQADRDGRQPGRDAR